VELEEVFEGYHIHSSLVVRSNSLESNGYDNMNSRLQHGFQVADCNPFVYRRQKEPEATRALGDDLPPTFSQGSLDRENNRVGRVPPEMFDRREDEVRLPVDDWLGEKGYLYTAFARSKPDARSAP
jgi:hypothetical protein